MNEAREINDIPASEVDFSCQIFYLRPQAKWKGSTSRLLQVASSEVFSDTYMKKEAAWISSSQMEEFGSLGKGNFLNATRKLTEAKKMNYLQKASSVFRILSHFKELCGCFFLFILAGRLAIKAEGGCAGVMLA